MDYGKLALRLDLMIERCTRRWTRSIPCTAGNYNLENTMETQVRFIELNILSKH